MGFTETDRWDIDELNQDAADFLDEDGELIYEITAQSKRPF